MVQRRTIQTIRADRFTHTPQNGISVEAVLGRVGVLEYQNPDRREFRPPDEVFASASLDSLRNAPVTVEHPPESRVHTENYQRHTVGHVGEDVRAVGDEIVATLHINAESAVQAILDGALLDISPGYDIQADATAGVDPVHGPYDLIQRDILYNHVSLLPPGSGRQGSRVGLRLDSSGSIVLDYSQPDRKDFMDPEQLKSMISDMFDPESIINSAVEKLQAQIPEMIKAELAAAATGGDSSEEDDSDVLDEADMEEKIDSEVEERLDSRLEAIRTYERVTGEVADYRKFSDLQLLQQAAEHRGLTCRTDSRDRLLGMLEVAESQMTPEPAARPRLEKRADSVEEAPFISNAERNELWRQRRAGR